MPVRVGEVLENPVTGERAVVRVAPQESNDYLLVVDLFVRPGGAVTGEHVHPGLAEAFTVVRGQLVARRDGCDLDMGPGMRLEVPAGVAHDWWNAGSEEVRVVVEIQPGDRFFLMARNLFMLAQDGKTNTKGMPGPLQAVAFGREFADTVRFTSPPQIVQRLMFSVLGPLARLAGRRGSYQEYARRQLPVVDLEPLPPDVVALIPSLSVRPPDIHT
jgi:mannose-6-phosphate isomerase-like protein (cupin superfamily)